LRQDLIPTSPSVAVPPLKKRKGAKGPNPLRVKKKMLFVPSTEDKSTVKTGVTRKQEEGTDVEAVKKKKRKRKHTKLISKSGMLLFAIQKDTTGVNWYDVRIGYKQTIKTASIRRHLSLQQASKKISSHHGDGGLEISLVQQ